MREVAHSDGLHVRAMPGSHVVTFGLDWPEERADELQGFALHRTDHSTGKAGWIDAQKRYLTSPLSFPDRPLYPAGREKLKRDAC